ncbi:DNA polymerase II large subunit [Candidatus Woesearchaeota archaeon]|nr:DNA polymerase II large subunit [Candidatus Woesearchaeota archaeon]
MNVSQEIKNYFEKIEQRLNIAYEICTEARQKGFDPELKVDIPIAKRISERVEGLISAVAPQILHSGVARRIEKLEKEYGSLDWRVALKIAEEVAKQKFCKFKTKIKAMETGIRVGLSYITLGVISAPLEGFIELKIKKTKNNEDYLSILYAGPIRAAGGTAEAVSLIITDYIRLKMGYSKYDPTEEEIKRTITEIRDYHERVTNLQYFPSDEEIAFLIKNLPIEINGDPTEDREVSNYKDLPRVETNRIRGGLCLVLAEGLAQKAKKTHKQLKRWGHSFGLDWDFLDDFLKLQKQIKAKAKTENIEETKLTPNYTYIKDLVAGRPILSHPLKVGGFRLRYGRTRLTGLAAAAIHPALMIILNKYIATGTQLKIERPGKAAAIVPCDYINGPTLKLISGDVIEINTEQEAKQHLNSIDKILFLGDILINYGDFSENGHMLVPCGYCPEWWIKEFEKAVVSLFGSFDLDKLEEILNVKKSHLTILFSKPIETKISFRLALNISHKLKIPLHPDFIYYWNAIKPPELFYLIRWLKTSNIKKQEDKIEKLILKTDLNAKNILERIGLPHILVNKEFIVIEKTHAETLFYFFVNNKNLGGTIDKPFAAETPTVDILNSLCDVCIKDKGGVFIGARMGRPEKAKMRKLTGSPHVLFPVGEQGGRLRCIQSALEKGKIKSDFPIFFCKKCNHETIYSVCEECNTKTHKRYYCRTCGILDKPCEKYEDTHGEKKRHISHTYMKREININYYFKKSLLKLNTKIYPDLIKGVKGTSNKEHIPEHLIKGILRSKHNIYVNKDGTTRYDMIELPITHFKPSEINTSIEKLHELGYDYDMYGKELTSKEQIIEIRPQDLILPDCTESPDELCSDVLFKIANFIDELLVKLYGLDPYYNLTSKKDLIGKLVVGLAPHTSAGTVGRVIGFSKTQAMLAHPLFHAAMRRNCDGDEACIILLMDALLNFSRSYLPDKRGSRTMDSPLVLTSILIAKEVDDEVHGMDLVDNYPLNFYEAAEQFKFPWEVKVLQIDNYLDTYKQYEGMKYTHKTSNLNQGVLCSSYKLLPSMEEKLKGQMDLAEKISAVNEIDVARLVIEKHFLRDIRGNLRKYSTQQFRCVKCNTKYRRPPLVGKCTECGGRIIFTISKGSIVKYVEPSLSLARRYNVSPYLSQVLQLTKNEIASVLGKEKEIQQGLGKWFG